MSTSTVYGCLGDGVSHVSIMSHLRAKELYSDANGSDSVDLKSIGFLNGFGSENVCCGEQAKDFETNYRRQVVISENCIPN